MLVANEKWLQTADTKWKKQNNWNYLKIPNSCLPASIRWRKQKQKTPPNHNSLIDNCLQLQSEEHKQK